MSFATDGFEVVKSAVHPQTLSLCVEEIKIQKNILFLTHNETVDNKFRFGDLQVKKSFSVYSLLCFESLSNILKPMVESITKKTLLPTYSYSRIYYNGAVMSIHKDRPSCEYSMSVCIRNDIEHGPWPLWFEDRLGDNISINLDAGDLVVYKGDELNHWRDEYGGNEQVQAFLHFVDAKGKYTDYVFDKRLAQGLTKEHNDFIVEKRKASVGNLSLLSYT